MQDPAVGALNGIGAELDLLLGGGDAPGTQVSLFWLSLKCTCA